MMVKKDVNIAGQYILIGDNAVQLRPLGENRNKKSKKKNNNKG
jgi:hypothetical protein